MVLTDEIIEDIIHTYKRVRSPFKVAKAVGIDVNLVWQVLDANGDRLARHEERWGGQGRPDLQQYVVARTRAGVRWDNQDPAIAEARRQYEEGTVELATGRDGAYLILYAVPRRRKQPRPDYFTLEVSI